MCVYVCERKVADPGEVPIQDEAHGPSTDQHVLLWTEHQLLVPCGQLLPLLPPARARSSVAAAATSVLRNREGPGDQEPEVVWDVRGVGQLQVVGGHQLAQHLGGHTGGGG